MAVDIGRIAYQAYCKNSRDKLECDFPKWEVIGYYEQDAWRHAAVAVLQQIDKEREDSEQGLIG